MLCELDYDLKKFGDILLKIRTKGKLTQNKIRELTGIHPDTIKGLEYGLRLPSLDTVNKLSDIYNINILNILTECKFENDGYLLKVKNHIDLISYKDTITDIDVEIEKIRTYKDIYADKLNSSTKSLLIQLEYFLKLLKMKNKVDIMNALETERLCYEAIKITHQNFDENKLSLNYYSILELRILSILSISKVRQTKFLAAISISEYVVTQFQYHSISDPSVNQFVLQSYYTLAYQNFIFYKDQEVLEICEKGIKFARSIYTTKFLSHFYFRLGISQIHLNDPNHLENLSLSLKYLQINQEYELLEKYNQVLMKKYHIDLTKLTEVNPFCKTS